MGSSHSGRRGDLRQSSSSSYTFLLLIVLVFVGFYFLMIRPQRRQQQQAQQQQRTLAPGSRVKTTAGMYATVAEVDGDDVILEVAPGVEVRYIRRAVMEVITSGEDEETELEADDEAEYAEDAGYQQDDYAEDSEPSDVETAPLTTAPEPASPDRCTRTRPVRTTRTTPGPARTTRSEPSA